MPTSELYILERPKSALGQKQTFAVQNRMSALPPKADITCPFRQLIRKSGLHPVQIPCSRRVQIPCSFANPDNLVNASPPGHHIKYRI